LFASIETAQNHVIVIVISKLLKRRSKAKRRAPAYSRALRHIKGYSMGSLGPVARGSKEAE